jgi:hypothetical protein
MQTEANESLKSIVAGRTNRDPTPEDPCPFVSGCQLRVKDHQPRSFGKNPRWVIWTLPGETYPCFVTDTHAGEKAEALSREKMRERALLELQAIRDRRLAR